MKEALEEFERWGTDVIFGRARGFRASVMRIFLWFLSGVYRYGVSVRLARYRKGKKRQHYLGTQVISIGNITVGGTGKTPVVELFARTLRERGRKPAILSRGYKSKKLDKVQEWRRRVDGEVIPAEEMPKVVSDGGKPLLRVKHAGDEPWMLAKNLPGVSVVVDKNRVKGGSFAVGELEADILILDDGLQYLDLAHSTDVVLVDQNAPFGTGQMLPRGTLREPACHLCRADYIFITKCDGSSNEELIRKIRKYNRYAEIVECTHGPKHLENLFTGEKMPLDFLKDKYIAAISGIAVPQSFEKILKKLGAHVEFHRVFSDHHSFNQREIDRFMNRCMERDIELIITTEKDAVRFRKPTEMDVPIYFLRIEVDILEGQEVWEKLVERICGEKPSADPLLLQELAG